MTNTVIIHEKHSFYYFSLLITYTEGNEPLWKGFFYAGVLFFSAIISTLVLAKHNYIVLHTGMKVKTALVSAVYRKALRLSNAAKRSKLCF